MKRKTLVTIAAVCAAFAVFAGCNGSNAASTSTTANSAAVTTAVETTTGMSDSGTENGDVAGNLFFKGVWLAHKDSHDGEPVQYFVFNDETSGHTDRVDGTGGVSFSCEQNGTEIMFHFGSADDNTKATFDLGDSTGTFDYGDGNVVTYAFEYMPDLDPDTFETAGEDQGDMGVTAPLFENGVWLAHKDSHDGEPVQYFVFNDETSGHTDRVDGTGGVSFSCEQNGTEIMFHFGSADDNTKATFDLGDSTGTFDYGDGNVVTYAFEYMPDLDPDTFDASALG